MKKSLVHFVDTFSELSLSCETSLFICDDFFCHPEQTRRISPFKNSLLYPVSAGERLKDLVSFPQHVQHILELTKNISPKHLNIVALGGGSVLDFAGFVASVLKRGVNFISIPSTWLAAVDAAHGGKTALNVGGVKNQVGTFYPASDIYIVKKVLDELPLQQAKEGFVEMLKMALLSGGEWAENLLQQALEGTPLQDLLWNFLPQAIDAKNEVVSCDPYEQTGERRVLNLGHTVGHVLETLCQTPHGIAVAHGFLFSLKWSVAECGLDEKIFEMVKSIFSRYEIVTKSDLTKCSREHFLKVLAGDKKKNTSESTHFIFLKDLGKPVHISKGFEEISKQFFIRSSE